MPRIDVHHHYFAADLKKVEGYANIGWRAPLENVPWSPELSLKAMDASGIDISILSFPALHGGSVSSENRTRTRNWNIAMASCRNTYPTRFGFFACLPFLDDVDGALEELAHAFDELHADGISLSSSYGEGMNSTYVGDDKYEPIWAELNRRQAVVFLHGAQIPSSTPYPHALLGIPISEVPNETFKAAALLVVTGRKRKYPDVKIILAHMGGSTPFLAARVAVLSNHMGCLLSPDEIIDNFKTFYFDTALSAYETNLVAIDSFIRPDQLLFGTDFPAVSIDMARWYTTNLEQHYAVDSKRLEAVMFKNAYKLFPRLRLV